MKTKTIKVIRFEIQEDTEAQIRKLIFYLKAPRSVWLTDDRLILEYPLKYKYLKNIGDAVLFSLLPIAYIEGCNIELPPTLCIEEETQIRVNKICNIWNKWFVFDRKVICFADKTNSALDICQERHGALLFSGGVDSMFTFQRKNDEIKYLIFYKGADVPVSKIKRFSQVRDYLIEFAKEQNKEIIFLSTNTHYLGVASWEHMAFGSEIIGPILALSNIINKIYISSSYSQEFERGIPCGAHPDVDPLISLKNTKTIHYGLGTTRLDRIKSISNDLSLLKSIRVCGNVAITDYNCGHCEKCFRTSMVLSMLGIPYYQTTFPKASFDFHNIALFIENNGISNDVKPFWSENLAFSLSLQKRLEAKEKLEHILQEVLNGYYEKYKEGVARGLYAPTLSKWVKIEKLFGLKPDSLLWLKKIIRSIRGRPYKNFIKTHAPLQKI